MSPDADVEEPMPPGSRKWDIAEFAAYAHQQRRDLHISYEHIARRVEHRLNTGRTPLDGDWQDYTAKQVQRVLENDIGRQHFTEDVVWAWIYALEMDEAKAWKTLRALPADVSVEGVRAALSIRDPGPEDGRLALAG